MNNELEISAAYLAVAQQFENHQGRKSKWLVFLKQNHEVLQWVLFTCDKEERLSTTR